MLRHYLSFEKPLEELEARCEELRRYVSYGDKKKEKELRSLEKKLREKRKEIFSKLTPWQIVQLARHINRPRTLDYIEGIFDEFVELHGDRRFGDDPSVIAGIGRVQGKKVFVVGHQRGKDPVEMVKRNFGMANPEGYRKAMRMMDLSERFKKPLVTFVDTPGAYPGIGAEERGQFEAIASSLLRMASLKVPIITFIIGEGGSGGALAIGMGDKVYMLQFSVYSVISPEGCAAIIWRDSAKADKAASILGLTSWKLKELGVVDGVVEEPPGGAHVDPEGAVAAVKEVLLEALGWAYSVSWEDLPVMRYEKYRKMGVFGEGA